MTTINKYYRKYMEDDIKERGTFLNKNRTKSVRDETKVSQSVILWDLCDGSKRRTRTLDLRLMRPAL